VTLLCGNVCECVKCGIDSIRWGVAWYHDHRSPIFWGHVSKGNMCGPCSNASVIWKSSWSGARASANSCQSEVLRCNVSRWANFVPVTSRTSPSQKKVAFS
jgi:hypothetical protein